MTLTVGVDIGGTKIAAGVVDENGEVLASDTEESPATDPSAIVETITHLVRTITRGHEVSAAGVAAAGFVDKARTTVLFAPNLAWRNEPLDSRIEAGLGLPVVIENDANAAAWGEFRFGAGADVEDLLLVTVGTGVGGGIVTDGELVRGGFGFGAEIGHLRVVPGGVPCGCGNDGCLESYASGRALVRMTREAAAADPRAAAALLRTAGGDPQAIEGPAVTELARQGDAFSIARLAELGRWLGEGIASLSAVLDPTAIVIGGGVSLAGDLLLEPTRRAFESSLTARDHRPIAEIRLARLGNTAGMIGAADLARVPR